MPVNIYQAKTQFSKLLRRVRAGEEITIADAGVPVAKLVPITAPRAPRVLGGDRGRIWIAPDAFSSLTGEELAAWDDSPLFPEPGSRESAPGSPARGSTRKPRATSRR